ncbi:MAG: transporter [Verrucomicrobia bacterium]|nr:transporter [Verrucomicrobiota bacterium]
MNTLHKRQRLLSIALAAGTVLTNPAFAEEGGSGHYAPGGVADFLDALPARPGLAVANYFMYYDGSASGTLPFGGRLTLDSHAQAYSDSFLVMYATNWELLGGHYVPAVGIPYVWLEVDGKISGRLRSVGTRDTANGLGDILLYPFMLGWAKDDLRYDLRLGIYAPTGDYEEGRLANVGKNYWTFEPMVSVSWLSSKIGTEVSACAGLDFSTKNAATDYQSGDVFHLDVTAAQHLPLGKLGTIGLGANAFYYQQFTGDSGSGAVLGDFAGRTVGVGPVLSFVTKLGKSDLAAEVKWLPELDVKNRLKGGYVWFKVGMGF